MKLWPWGKRENRAGYGEAVIQAFQAAAERQPATTATGAFEAGVGMIARAIASAEVSGPDALTTSITPTWLAMASRALQRYGEFVAAIRVEGGRVRLSPCGSWHVEGGPNPAGWTYQLYESGPSHQVTRNGVPAASVVHVRLNVDPAQPWRGFAPLVLANQSGRLSAETVKALADESSTARGTLLPLPVDGQDPTVTALKQDLRTMAGKLTLVEGANSWGLAKDATGKSWDPVRIGADPPQALVELSDLASREVLGALGVPPVLLATNPAGTASREGWRTLLFSTVAPLGRILTEELSAKLDGAIALGWDELRASDIAGRSRAYQSLTGAGMDPAKAAKLAGLMTEE